MDGKLHRHARFRRSGCVPRDGSRPVESVGHAIVSQAGGNRGSLETLAIVRGDVFVGLVAMEERCCSSTMSSRRRLGAFCSLLMARRLARLTSQAMRSALSLCCSVALELSNSG